MSNFLDPAILFFVLGVLAGVLKSNLEIPQPISRFLSLYLLMALGLKGGFALAKSGLTPSVALNLACAVLLAVAVPAISYKLLRRFINGFDAAAVAATYGSVSAVTFITATRYLDGQGVAFGGHMAAAMALMVPDTFRISVDSTANAARAGNKGGSSALAAPRRLTNPPATSQRTSNKSAAPLTANKACR